ncbi:hypothetical protein D3C72_1717480 [compost metagenome]
MSYQQYRAIDLRHHLARALGVVGQRRQRQFDGTDGRVAVAPQFGNDAAPVGGAAPETVDEDDGGLLAHANTPCGGSADGGDTGRAARQQAAAQCPAWLL